MGMVIYLLNQYCTFCKFKVKVPSQAP